MTDHFMQVNDKFFYLDAAHFGDKELLGRLTPSDPDMDPKEKEVNM